MNLEDATAVFTNLARAFPDQEMLLRTPRLGESRDGYTVEIRNRHSKLSDLSPFIDEVLRSLDRKTLNLEGEVRVECEHVGASDGALWLVVTTRLLPADEATGGSPE
jgi:hypothetical protein